MTDDKEEELRERWPSADRAAVITDDGEVHGFDRTDGETDGEDDE